ncbi:MAG: GNAT family N-acetyltransferase [Caldilineaceae bacterium]|nr:GNAT family N-acetyltransferase [Caldilineaceae bacterium]
MKPEHLPGYAPVQTERLRLIPLSLAQMQWQLNDFAQLERSLGAQVTGAVLEKELHSTVARSIAYMKQESEDAVWNTFWAAVLKDENIFVGGIGFKGPPNNAGEVEIGYGIEQPYRNRGLATEMVNGLLGWAFAQPGVGSVIAETNYTNTLSARVLQKAGFLLYEAVNHYLYWRKVRPTGEKTGRETPEADTFDLYDLTVVVESIDGHCTCDMREGDCFHLRNSSSLSLPDGGHFCVYALQAVLPLLPAKQRLNHPADWMETDSRAVCPDPACKLVMRVDRTSRRTLRHDDVSPIPWEPQ